MATQVYTYAKTIEPTGEDVIIPNGGDDTCWVIKERPGPRRKLLYVRGLFNKCCIKNIGGFDHVDIDAHFVHGDGLTHMRSGPSTIRLHQQYGTAGWFALLNEGIQDITVHSYRLGYNKDGSNFLDQMALPPRLYMNGKIDTGGRNATYRLHLTDTDSLYYENKKRGYRYGFFAEASPGPTVQVHAILDYPNLTPDFHQGYVEQPNNPNLETHSHSVQGRVKGLTVGPGTEVFNLTASDFIRVEKPHAGEPDLPTIIHNKSVSPGIQGYVGDTERIQFV